MSYNVRNIRNDNVPKGKILVYWLGGYGFMLKFSNEKIICIDPYLSDCVERIAGFPRLSLAPLAAEEVNTDIYLITHEHPDHLDVDSFDAIAAKNPSCKIVAGKSCESFLKTKNVSPKIIAVGEDTQLDGIKIIAVPADHGSLCRDGIGFIIQFENRTIYFTGDTCLNEQLLMPAIKIKPEIIVPCINPKFGNLGEDGAAELVKKCGAKIAIPSHFGLFAEHGGDPEIFKSFVNKLSPQTIVQIFAPGQGVEIMEKNDKI
ncbi:MAG: hypothetical protein A2Y12_03730 [Planctomycetes bacterium GWF2_42_9]|nr:MAG: hypothetical protein A2Y12_03730 [Planctomycetes bacterium GWF2_42_9]